MNVANVVNILTPDSKKYSESGGGVGCVSLYIYFGGVALVRAFSESTHFHFWSHFEWSSMAIYFGKTHTMSHFPEIGLTIPDRARSRLDVLLLPEKRTLGRTGGKNGVKKA